MAIFAYALFFTCVFGYENLSGRNTTVLTQSSTYEDNFAFLANDGILNTTYGSCGYTEPYHPKAWLQVDLGKAYSISSVKVYYRKEGDGVLDWKQYRFRQFFLDVSNLPVIHTTTTQRKRCYTDHTTYPNLPPNVITIPCKHTVRYIIVETTYDAPEDKYTGAMLEICEMQVYGCNIGYYGDDCKLCPDDCYACDIDDGTCSCDLRLNGLKCPKDCGSYCNDGCNIDTGICYACTEGRFSESCTETCGDGCVSGCDRYRGNCMCKPGWTGGMCDVQESWFNQLFLYTPAVCFIVVFLLVIILVFRKTISKRRKQKLPDLHQNQRSRGNGIRESALSIPHIYDTVKDDTNYQEFVQLDRPSYYDQLELRS